MQRQEKVRDKRDNGDNIRRELILQGGENVPFLQVVVLNAIEDCRRAIKDAEDGGLASLLALWSVLPREQRAQFADLPGEIMYQGRVHYLVRRPAGRLSKHTIPANPIPRLEYSPEQGRIIEVYNQAQTITVRHARPAKVYVEDTTPRQTKRQFVMVRFIQILDILDDAGLLRKSRAEYIGGEL